MEYEQMYLKLFNGISKIIEELKELQKESEELYISAEEKQKSDDELWQ